MLSSSQIQYKGIHLYVIHEHIDIIIEYAMYTCQHIIHSENKHGKLQHNADVELIFRIIRWRKKFYYEESNVHCSL